MSTTFQGVEKASAAFRLMQQMGWEEGNGLGKDQQGMKQHIRVRSKQDNAGIGVDQKMKAQTLWKVNTMEYDNVLQKLKVVVGQAVEAGEKRRDVVKIKVTDAVKGTHQNDREELRVLKATRPQGRYKSRERVKMIGAYSSTDLTAILGGVQGQTQVPVTQLTPISEEVEPRDHVVKAAVEEEDKDLAPASKRVCRAKPQPEFPDLPVDWWGNKFGFVRAGKLGAMSGALKTERAAFREQDQEELAKLAAEKATKGKQGLGAADRVRIGKGGGWKGQRKALLDGDSDEEDNDGKEESGGNNDVHAESSVDTRRGNNVGIELETQTNDIIITEEKQPTSGVCDGNIKTSSWKKICKQLLREAPSQTLSLKRLEKRFSSKMLTACGTEVRLDREKLRKSSRFVIEGKKVSLSSV